MDKHYALAREAILAALTAYTGITTADGATPANNTLICADLISKNDFISEKTILIGSGDAKFEDSGASSFVPGTGTITVVSAFSAQIKKGTIFRVLNISSIEIDVATINTKIGTNADAAGTTTLFARLRQIVDDYLAGTYGLSALNTNLDTLLTRLSAARASYLTELAPAHIPADIDTLKTYCDILDDATNGLANIKTLIDAAEVKLDKLAGETPEVGSATENWQTAEANVVSIGANDTRYKLHSLLLSIHNLVGTTITARLYMQVKGAERKVYEQTFDATSDPPGLWVVNGTIGIHEVLRVTLQSNNAADNNKEVDYDYMLEAQ